LPERADEGRQPSVAIVGVGNELMQDDGVGVHAVRRLQRVRLDPRALCIEAGTALAEALDLVPPGSHVLVVDAASGDGQPGSLYRYRLDDLAVERGVSLHETSLPEAFALAQVAGTTLGDVVVLGVEPSVVAVGTELSPTIEERMPSILEAVQAEVARLLGNEPADGTR